MINAHEAKALYDKSGGDVQDYLTHNVEKEIIKQAEGGKRYYILHLGADQCALPKLSRLNQGVYDELKRMNYIVRYGFYGEKYVPRGRQDDNGDGPMFQNFGITIGW